MLNILKIMKQNSLRRIAEIKNIKIIVVILIALFLLFSIIIFEGDDEIKDKQDRLNAIKQPIDCSRCHTTGQPAFTAGDTIDMQSCYRCHRADIGFLVPISKEVHGYHKGNTSILPGYPYDIDYSARHKDILQDCNTCHIYKSGTSPACAACHSGRHIENKKSILCENCHGSLDRLFGHESITLETHDVFGNRSCKMCHSPDKTALELANGKKVPIDRASNLCKQCHFRVFGEWKNGDHVSVIECAMCHNPHSPKNINQTILKIAKTLAEVEETPKETELRRKYSYDTVEE